LVSMGGIGLHVVGHAAGATLTGTVGINGEFSLGLAPDGILYLENRRGGLRQDMITLS